MSELPMGWVTTKLGEICSKPQYGYTTRAASEGNIRFLRTTDITKGLNWLSVPYCEVNPEKPEQYLLQPGDIVISRAGSVGFSALIESAPGNAVFASYLIRFRPLEGILGKYLKRYLESDFYWQQITEKAAGNALQNVNAQKLADLDVVVAPIAEQARIAQKLDELLAQVDTLKARIDAIPALLKRFRQSVLAAAVSGRLTEEWRTTEFGADPTEKYFPIGFGFDETEIDLKIPKTWQTIRLGDICTVISGFAFSSGDFVSAGVPAIKISNIQYGVFETKNQEFLPPQLLETHKRFIVHPLDLLMALTRPITNNTLKVCKYPKDAPTALLNQRVCKLDLANPESKDFFEYLFQAEYFRKQVNDNLSETLQPNLSPKDLSQFTIGLPPISEQTEIVRRVEQLFAFADQLEAKVATAQARIDRLTQSILAKAFRGELVPQDPNDEPASLLLERIQAQRAAAPKAKRGRKTA